VKGRNEKVEGREGEGKTLWICSPSPQKNFLATPLVITRQHWIQHNTFVAATNTM